MLKEQHYRELGYSTFFNTKTGAFARIEHNGHSEPLAAPFPELLDISITNWCDRSCSFCYRNSSPQGLHMALADYKELLLEAKKYGVYQVALGGGNPNQHPDFVEMLRFTREECEIVPSYTTNGRGVSEDILAASARYCGAVAISAYAPYSQLEVDIKKFLAAKIKTNLHFILSSDSIETAIEWLEQPPRFLDGINAIVFLNYKPINSEATHSLLTNNERLPHFLELTRMQRSFKVGFDSCMVSGLGELYQDSKNVIEGCDAARFSMYIDENLRAYPCSFLSARSNGESISEFNGLLGVWSNSNLFEEFREHFLSSKCNGCDWKVVCGNGCPVFPEINLCDFHE